MRQFGKFYLDQEKDIIVELYMKDEVLSYVLRTPNHHTGNLITNLAKLCHMPISFDENGLKIVEGTIPCYIDGSNRKVYIFRMDNTKVANIYPDGTVEMKASIPSISKTLMSQTKNYRPGIEKTVLKTYILRECKFRTDLHTHMNANLAPDILIALGIFHQIRYPLYYIRKLDLKYTERQGKLLEERRKKAEEQFADSGLTGKYLKRKIEDNTFINFADLILHNLDNAAYNIPRIRASLAVLKDGQAVFTNLEKVYLYRYVFTKGIPSEDRIRIVKTEKIPDEDIRNTLLKMMEDHEDPRYMNNSLFQNKLLWIARGYAQQGVEYAEISDTTLVKKDASVKMLKEIHEVMPHIYEETGVMIRFLCAIRRIPLTIIKDQVTAYDYLDENLAVLHSVMMDPYVAGSDFVGEEMNDIMDLKPVIQSIVHMSKEDPSFVIRIHAGENDSLRDNVYNSVMCVKNSLEPGQKMPHIRIGHGLYTANLKTPKGKKLIQAILDCNAVLEFQITSNVRLNNLSALKEHPLKEYLKAGIRCVQGTDGAALYGTDSIDEELALEKLLELRPDDLKKMCAAEEEVLKEGKKAFARKMKKLKQELENRTYEEIIDERLRAYSASQDRMVVHQNKLDAKDVFRDMIREMPADKLPVIIAGGSFGSAGHRTVVREKEKELIDRILDTSDPGKVFFVTGHTVSGYEKYLLERNSGRFEIFAFAPALVTPAEKTRILKAGCAVRIAIEPLGMGIYKSIAYEIFKRRNSILIALDGNSAGANLIQEAKNGKRKAQIFVNGYSRALRAKAETLQGYAKIFRNNDEVVDLIRDLIR